MIDAFLDSVRVTLNRRQAPRDGRGGFRPGAGFLAVRVQVDVAEESGNQVRA